MARLSVILSNLLRNADDHRGEKQRTRLPNGLSIDIMIDPGSDGQTHLQIHRSGVYPSRAEWDTVLRNWPYPIGAEPKLAAVLGRHYLIACWPTPRRLDLDVCAQTQEAEDDRTGTA